MKENYHRKQLRGKFTVIHSAENCIYVCTGWCKDRCDYVIKIWKYVKRHHQSLSTKCGVCTNIIIAKNWFVSSHYTSDSGDPC